mgnify:CR=1 FL=1
MGYLLQNGGLGMAGDWIITGGRPLQGRVEVPAAKNSALPLLAAGSEVLWVCGSGFAEGLAPDETTTQILQMEQET